MILKNSLNYPIFEWMKKQILYWIFQIFGWLFFITIGGIQNKLNGKSIDYNFVISMLTIFSIGIGMSQILRFIIIKINLFNKKLVRQILILVTCILTLSLFFNLVYFSFEYFFLSINYKFKLANELLKTLNWGGLLFLWTLLYYAYLFVEKFRKQEITNLKLSAAKAEVELNLLRSQMNPHFIFNSMNTIRALVDDEPEKAKNNVLKLSNILRNSLLIGKKNLIPFNEELKLVKDYLDLEQTRFEERLKLNYEIDPKCMRIPIPPMLLQTLVENGIKHGISKLTKGGILTITATLENNHLKIIITNSGIYKVTTTNSGIGIENTQKRLNLLFNSKASLKIYNADFKKEVITELLIPY